jgi:hypothetical protein
MSLSHWSKPGLTVLVGALASLFALATCGGRNDSWDGDPDIELCGPTPVECDGLAGSRCSVGDDCDDGVCCLTDDCGHGMCTYLCADNRGCPPTMECHGGFCFYGCNSDNDCGPGQECEHGETVCQY